MKKYIPNADGCVAGCPNVFVCGVPPKSGATFWGEPNNGAGCCPKGVTDGWLENPLTDVFPKVGWPNGFAVVPLDIPENPVR